MTAHPTTRVGRWVIAYLTLLVGLVAVSASFAARSGLATRPPATTHAVVKGTAGKDIKYTGNLRRSRATRWCGSLQVRVPEGDSGSGAITRIFSSGRECGSIGQQSVVMLTLACPSTLGVGAVLRGRPRLRATLPGGRTRSVPLRRIRDRQTGTFYSLVLTAEQLPAKIRIVGGEVVADVPKISEVC